MNKSFAPTFDSFNETTQPTYKKKSSLADIAAASFELSWKQAETSSVGRIFENFVDERDDDIISPEQANSMYRLPVPINKPISKELFGNYVEEDLERKELQNIIANGRGTTLESVVSFGASIGAQVIDPIGIGSGILTGTLATKALAKGALMGSRLGRNMAEGVVGNLASEALFVIPAAKQEQQDVETYNNLMNAVYGGVGFPAAISGLKLGYKKTRDLMSLVEQRMAGGKKPMGTVLGNETVTGNAKESLDARADELRQEAAQGVSTQRQEEIRAELDNLDTARATLERDLEQAPKIREEENAAEVDMYFDKQLEEEALQIKNQIEQPIEELQARTDSTYEEILLDETLTDANRADFEADKALLDTQRQKNSELTKALGVCMKRLR